MPRIFSTVKRGFVRTAASRLLNSTEQVKTLKSALVEQDERLRQAEREKQELVEQLATRPKARLNVIPSGSSNTDAEMEALRVFAGLDKPRHRHETNISCRMADGLYIQADGSMPCYCSGGITRKLGQIDGGDLMKFYRGKTMALLRAHLADGAFPWPECDSCHVKTLHADKAPDLYPNEIPIIHLEPTSVCNLRCPGCHATEVMEGRAPARRAFFPLEKFKEMIDSIDIPVRQISFCGYGEPLLNVDVPKMIAYAKQKLSPSPSCAIDTNANIRKLDVEELIASGVNLIRFALDGAFQENYEQYRRLGNLNLALDFVRRVAAERNRQKAHTKLVWKYVIFAHASSIEEIEHAIRFCAEIGIGFDYSRAAGILPGAGNRDVLTEQIRELVARYGALDWIGGSARGSQVMKFGEDEAWKYA